EPTASARQVTSAYRSLVRLLHPDTRPVEPGSAERLRAVVAAYEVLHDPRLRTAYDAERESARPHPSTAPTSARPPAAPRRVPVRVIRDAGSAEPTSPGAAMRPGAEPLVRAGPVRSAPPGAPARARDDAGDLWEWILHRLWEVDPWL
ncbi:J domain-containing protein, partial [Streptacidiphilus griseoplanus]|uniref:J domain-containing protein n=1 Tax=Peterkaempfera griseoplana TaxID=66896 RepID=UPI0006E43A95